MLSNESQIEYFKKMIIPYEKKREKKYAIIQFVRGAGNELTEKFWQDHSSSRMAYDLYSWMQDKDHPEIRDFEFEKQLPPLKSGGMGPNMDVYIETKDEIIFVESKFTEKANLNYMNENEKGETYLSPGYFADVHGEKRLTLSNRFYGYGYAARFAEFCKGWEKVMKANPTWRNRDRVDWFEPKQETCHLCGILFFLEKNRKLIKGKKIRLYNIYWEMNGDEKSAMEKAFIEKAQEFINNVVKDENFGIKDFEIDAFSVQEMLKDNCKLSSHIRFPEGKEEEIIDRNTRIVGNYKRGHFSNE
jgi:hypothetical protein